MKLHLTILFILFQIAGWSQLPSAVTKNIRQRIDEGWNPAVVIGIIDKDGMHYYSFGTTKTGGKKVNEHSIFEIGSISKVFTAVLLADEVIKGEMETDDPVQQYLPASVKMPMYDGANITLGHLSDHTSSLPRMPDNFNPADPANPYADYTIEQLYEFINGYEIGRPIGSEYSYSNLAVGLLGHVLELQNKKSYDELLSDIITGPLAMGETSVKLSKKMKKNLAYGHYEGTQVPNWDLPTFAGAGGIRSSAYDMLKFLEAAMQRKESPIRRAFLLTQIPRHDKADNAQVGLGWHILKGSSGPLYVHDGATGGYTSFAGFSKGLNKGVVVLTNSNRGVADIGLHLLDPMNPLGAVIPHVTRELQKYIEANGPAGLESKYDELKRDHTDEYDFSEEGINSLGYYYLRQKKYAASNSIFLLNIREYPSSANVYDSYGESLMEEGKKDEAIPQYLKSLELNPGNENAVQMLERMGVKYEAKEVKVDEAVLNTLTGTYQLFPGFTIEITTSNGELRAQATGQAAFQVYPASDLVYFYKVVDAQITFIKNDNGEISGLLLRQNGRTIEGKKIKA